MVAVMTKQLSPLLLFLLLQSWTSCSQNEPQTETTQNTPTLNEDSLKIVAFFEKENRTLEPSISSGTVGKGHLKNGKIMPFYGPNFTYFSAESYLASRAFTSDVVRNIVLNGYQELHLRHPDRHFFLMELSHKNGGPLYPHHTHQNGTSVDFMMQKLKESQPDYSLDTLGPMHYFLQFDDAGRYVKNTEIQVDFELVAEHIFILSQEAEKLGWTIEKVIIKLEYKDELFATSYGQKLLKKGVYFAKSLSKEVNDIHDDHFHIDFKKL